MGSKASGVSAPLNETFNNHLLRLADSDLLVDCEFVVGPEKNVIKGHKVLFCAASEVFHAMFLRNLKETKTVHVEDIELEIFQGLKKYIYTGQTAFKSVFQALAIFVAARKYLIEPLKDTCECYIDWELRPSQVLELLDSCRLNSVSELDSYHIIRVCHEYMRLDTANVLESAYFLSANIETIELILKSPHLRLESEIELFCHFERWALAEAERRKIPAEDIATSFGSLKKHIRFLTISMKDFEAYIKPSPLLTSEEKNVIAKNIIKFVPNLTSKNITMLRKHRMFPKPLISLAYCRRRMKRVVKSASNHLFRLADSDLLTDCEFIVGPQKTVIKGHKVFFCAASDVFHAMFLGNLKETKAVHIKDLEPDGFQGMKKYIYTGQTDFISAFQALATFVAARKYLIGPLKYKCEKHIRMKLRPSQVLEFLDSCKLNTISIFDDLSEIISYETAEVVNSDYFPFANIETIELILKSPRLKLNSEIEVFGHFERWALAEAERCEIPAEDIATSFGSLKKHIRFLTMSVKDFKARVKPSPLLTREEKRVIAKNIIKFDPNLTAENISMLKESRLFYKCPIQGSNFQTK